MKKKINTDRLSAGLVILPSIAAMIVFVYFFIGYTIKLSFENWNSLVPDHTFIGLKNWKDVFKSFRFRSDIRNMVFFTFLFILLVIVLGMSLAIILDGQLKGKSFFRTVFLFPMSLSYVVTGVVWRWLLNPEAGINILLGTEFKWYTDTAVYPGIMVGGVKLGFPVALISIIIATLWQLTGFSLALYLSGLSGISDEVREAARIDGATEWQITRKVIIPLLRPITSSVFILMFQISLKVFDLVYTITGSGPNYVTDMPAINMYESTFRGHFYSQGSVISVCMLLVVLLFVIPSQILSGRDGGAS